MESQSGGETHPWISEALAWTQPFRRAIRVHPLRGQVTGWGDLTPTPWNPQGYFHAADADPGDRLDYHTGAAYPQDAASQVPVRLLDPRPGETVIDVCAAPGSKSTQIGLALGLEGLLICADASPQRRAVLTENLARQGVVCAVVTPLPLHRLVEHAAATADAVLLDAPCSGHAVRSPRQVARMGERQGELLANAARLVAPGGRLVYSTCTPYRGENEDVITAFLAAHPAWISEAAALPGCDPDLADLGGVRLWPQRHGSEPFFALRLRAPSDGRRGSLAGRLPPSARLELPWHTWRRGELWFAATAEAAACALPSEARGLILGRGDDQRWDPWGAQAAIAAGHAAITVSRDAALGLWAGETLAINAPDGALLRHELGGPLGVADTTAAGVRLRLPSRLRRGGLR